MNLNKTMTAPLLRADCSRCAALCCVMPAFDNSQDFAIDKPAGAPCPNLDADNGCNIHQTREQMGFSGCVIYDCHGAGQRVTQEVFEGQSWRDHPDLIPAMGAAFSTMCEIHRLLLLLEAAANLSLSETERAELDEFREALSPDTPWTVETLKTFERSDYSKRIQTFFQSLKHHVKT